MSTTLTLDETTVTCDDENAPDALEDSRVLIDGGEFAIDPQDLSAF